MDTPIEHEQIHKRGTNTFAEEQDEAGSREKVACDICGAMMVGIHCKLRCLSCGYTRDCSDP